MSSSGAHTPKRPHASLGPSPIPMSIDRSTRPLLLPATHSAFRPIWRTFASTLSHEPRDGLLVRSSSVGHGDLEHGVEHHPRSSRLSETGEGDAMLLSQRLESVQIGRAHV